jgi:hypothetical protein
MSCRGCVLLLIRPIRPTIGGREHSPLVKTSAPEGVGDATEIARDAGGTRGLPSSPERGGSHSVLT